MPLLNWFLLSHNSMYWENVTPMNPWGFFPFLCPHFPQLLFSHSFFYIFVLWNHDLQLHFIFIPFLSSLPSFSFLCSLVPCSALDLVERRKSVGSQVKEELLPFLWHIPQTWLHQFSTFHKHSVLHKKQTPTKCFQLIFSHHSKYKLSSVTFNHYI